MGASISAPGNFSPLCDSSDVLTVGVLQALYTSDRVHVLLAGVSTACCRDDSIACLVIGILEHNAVAITARVLSECRYHSIINFGCVGAYTGKDIGIGDCFFISESRHFDVELPGDVQCAFDARPFRLAVLGDNTCPPLPASTPKYLLNTKARVCRTGSRPLICLVSPTVA